MRAAALGLHNPPRGEARSLGAGLIAPGLDDWHAIKRELMTRRFSHPLQNETLSLIAAPVTTNAMSWDFVLQPDGYTLLMVPSNTTTAYTFDTRTETFTANAAVLNGGSKFRGGTLHPNEITYMAPFGNGHIGSYNHASGVFTEDQYIVAGGLTKYEGLVVARDGALYAMPHGENTNVQTGGTYSISANVCTVVFTAHGFRVGDQAGIDFLTGTAVDKNDCGITAVSNNSFSFPYTTADTAGTCSLTSARKPTKVDPAQGTASDVGPTWASAGSDPLDTIKKFKCEGTAIGPAGMEVYGAPLWDNHIPVYDVSAGTLKRCGDFATLLGGQFGKFRGARLAWNDWIYFAPYASLKIAKIHAYTKEIQLLDFTSTAPTGEWTGIVAGQNGYLYLVPRYGANVGVLDPATDTLRYLAHGYVTGNAWAGGRACSNGNIYCTPFDADHVLAIDTGVRDFPPEMLLSPYFNHF